MNKLLVILIMFAVACVLIFKFLPIWASIAIVVVGLVSLRWILPMIGRHLFMVPFKMKGKALAGATIEVHEIRPAPAPERERSEDWSGEGDDGQVYDDDEEFDYSRFAWYHLDVTITPHPAGEEFIYWEPGELMLAGPGARADDIDDADDEVAYVHDLRIFSEGAFREYEGEKYEGPKRLELHVGVKPGVNALQCRYYFDLFGHVPIPAKPVP